MGQYENQSAVSDKLKLSDLERERMLRQGIESAFEELEIEALLSTIVANACQLLGADTGGVGLLKEEPRRMVMVAVHNLPEEEIGSEWLPGIGIGGLILTMGRPMIINRYGDIDPQKRPDLAEDAVIGVPVLRRKKLVGFLGIGAKSPRRFTQADVKILSQFGRACGVAIENARLFASTQESLKQSEALYQLATRLSGSLRLEDVVAHYIRYVVSELHVRCQVVLYERDSSGNLSHNTSVGRGEPDGKVDLIPKRMLHEKDELDDLLESGESLLFSDVTQDIRVPPGLRDLQTSEGRLALVLIPLISRGRRIGLVTLSRESPHDWTDKEVTPVLVTSAHLAASIDIRHEQERLAEARANSALAEERKRIARDLHDSVTQSLFAMQLLSQSLIGQTLPEGEERAQKVADMCRSSLREMRALLSELRPIDSQAHLLAPSEAMRSRLAKHANEIGIECDFWIDADSYLGASAEIDHALFRIAQEAITNAAKHSRCAFLKVVVKTEDDQATVEISDDGEGMPNETSNSAGFGLIGMEERAAFFGGKLDVKSEPGNGVRILATIPKTPWIQSES